MTQPQGAKALIATGEAAQRLGIGRSTLQNMFDYIPYLYVWKRETRLFPASYIDAYATFLRQNSKQATVPTARAFWATEEAQRLYQEAQDRITSGLSGITLNAGELMKLLCIGRMTITSWHQAGVFQVVSQTVKPKRNRGKGPKQVLLIPCREVRQALVWKAPTTRA